MDPLRCTRTQLAGIAADIILDNSFSRFNFDPENIVNLTMAIADRYNNVSYHNFSHGFGLMQVIAIKNSDALSLFQNRPKTS